MRRSIEAMIHAGSEERREDLSCEDGLRQAALTYGPELRAYATRKVASWSVAEDLVQETFLRAWRAAELFDATRGSARTWLFAILRNVIVDHLRARSRRHFTPCAAFDIETNDDADSVVAAVALHDALRRLTAQQREVIYHGDLRDRTHVEIAELLGIPVGTVRSRLHYARRALKRALTDA